MKRISLILSLLALLPLLVSAQGEWTIVKGDCTPSLNEDVAMARGHQRRLPYISKEWDANRTYRQLVILVSFKDRDFLMPDPQATYDSIFNYNGYNQRQGKGCVADYFRDQSNGLFNLQFDVYGPIKVSSKANPFSNPTIQTRNYGRDQMAEATQTLISEHPEIHYSVYDWDGDRNVNQIVYVFAGYSGNVNPNYGYVWPNTNYLDQTLNTPDGFRISSYTVSAELWPNDRSFGIGTICHEFSHSLGLPDIYPTNGNGYSIVDEWDLMDGGNFTNYGWSPPNYTPMEKYLLGWLNPIELTEAATIKNLQPSEEGGEVYRIRHSDSEWLMLENRQQRGWDTGAPGKGLVIYHVFYDLLAWSNNTVNNNNKRRYELVHADNMDYVAWDQRVGNVSPYLNKYMMNNQKLSTSPYPWTNSATQFVNNELTDNSVPPARMNYPNTKGTEFLGKPITNIQMTDDGLVSFDFMGGVPDPPAEYQLTYMVDGEIYKTIEVECGADITPEEEPTKEGYTFSGWSEIPETMPEYDVTVTGSFTINKYTLTYLVDSVEYKTIEVEYGVSVTPEEEPNKEGYTFSGWSEIPETMPANDVTVTGSFTINKYTLTYLVDSVEYKTIEVEYGASVTPEEEPTKEGYTFSGWSELPTTMPANDVTITGTFTVNKYTLTYSVDGEEYKSFEVEYGVSVTPEEEPTKEGYTFSGWSEIPETMPAKDVTITGTFTVNKYTLTYSVDGEEYKSYEVEYGSSLTPEEEPTKEGYTFSGWSMIPETMPAKDVTVTGTFTKGAYTLSYMVDGEVYKTVMYDYGTAITPEAVPTKEGYTFSGWSEIPESMPAKDVTITGIFSINQYTLTYQVDGEEYKSFEVEYSVSLTPEEEPTKEGYTFSGWSEIPETMPANDVTVTGSFTINKYTLTYLVDSVEYKTIEVEYGASVTPEEEPTKEGYTFSGWSELPTTMPANDVTVTGTFTVNTYTLTYSVDGEDYKSYEVEYGASVTPEEEPTKEGYTFSGWSETPETMPANDVTVTGTFTVNKYTLTYSVDGEEYKSYEVEYGSSLTPEEEPVKEGYTFSGWSMIPETMPAKDVTVTGTFTKGAYTLSYMVDDEVYKTVKYDYGTAITPEAVPTKEGYTFSGWTEIPETMPAKDITVTGTFTVNKYTLTYSVDGEDYKSYEVEYGASLTPEDTPTKEGYTFSGWSEIPATMPAKDVTVTGTFTINKYTLTYLVDSVEYKSFEVEYGTSVTPEEEPTKEGYTFSGWSEIPETMPANDIMVTGSFTINKYTLTYSVDGEEYKSYDIEYGASLTPEEEPTKEGYTFSGWSEIPATMPAKDVTISGSFTINKYTLTYLVDSVEYKTIEVEYGASVTPEEEPTKEGYTFSGWSEIPATMPAKDVTISGSFTINKYTLTYSVDGEEYKSFEVEYGVSVTPEEEPTKEGHTFSGWSELPETMPAKDVTITGTFTINKYKLAYLVDSVEYKTIEVEYGTSLTPEEEPTKEGYTFSGWSEIPETMPANDIMVTGSFTINKYTLTYSIDGEEYKSYDIEYGASLTLEEEPTKEGYTFSGWSEIPATMPAKDVTISGSFTINKYTLTYLVDSVEYKTIEVEYGASVTPEEEPTKEGYTFSGWSEIPETMPANDVMVTGTFTINKYTLTYMIDNEVYKVVEYNYGAAITPEPQPEGDYVTFLWKDVPETMPANNVTVYADYQTGIGHVLLARGIKHIYSPSGKRIEKLQKGLNIVVMNDGTVIKVVMK